PYAPPARRYDGAISREGSVTLRRAVLSLGVGLWRLDPAARAYAVSLRTRGKPPRGAATASAKRANPTASPLWTRGKPPGGTATAMANRANRIAFAMVRDQRPYDPNRWR